jgi:hypothetical protein
VRRNEGYLFSTVGSRRLDLGGIRSFPIGTWSTGQTEDAMPTNPTATERAQQSPASSEIQIRPSGASSSSSDQTQDELAFIGRIQQEKGNLLLKDPVTRLNYQLDDQGRAEEFIGSR